MCVCVVRSTLGDRTKTGASSSGGGGRYCRYISVTYVCIYMCVIYTVYYMPRRALWERLSPTELLLLLAQPLAPRRAAAAAQVLLLPLSLSLSRLCEAVPFSRRALPSLAPSLSRFAGCYTCCSCSLSSLLYIDIYMYTYLLAVSFLSSLSFPIIVYVQIYRNLRRNLKCAFENLFSNTPSGPGFSRCL